MRKMVDHSGEVHNGWRIVRPDSRRGSSMAWYYEARCELCGRVIINRYTEIKARPLCRCDKVRYLASRPAKPDAAERYLYMAVTAGRYELPVAVADSIPELAQLTGYQAKRIAFAVTPSGQRRYGKTGKAGHNLRFCRVPLERGENEVSVQA